MSRVVEVELFLDVSCPWSFGAQGRIRTVLDELAADPTLPRIELAWRFLRLLGDLPSPPPTYEELVAEWRQTPDEARQEILQFAADSGVVIDFWKAEHVYDPLLAHRLLAIVRDSERRDGLPGMWQLAHAVWSANFTHGVDITDIDQLRDGLAGAGIQLDESVWALLADPDAHMAETRADHARALEVNLDGVPRLVVGDTIVQAWFPIEHVRRSLRDALGAIAG